MGKINKWKIILSAALFAIIGQIIHSIGAFLSMGYYTMPDYLAVWSKLMMPTAGPPPLSFTLYSLLFGFIGGLLFAIVYALLKFSVPGRTIVKKGLIYGFLVFLVGGIPGYLALILLINLPFLLILLWAIESLVINLLGGMVVAALNK